VQVSSRLASVDPHLRVVPRRRRLPQADQKDRLREEQVPVVGDAAAAVRRLRQVHISFTRCRGNSE
jgi:hypothetical protein